MLKQYPKFKKGQTLKILKNLSSAQKTELDKILLYRKSRGLKGRGLDDLKRYLLQLYHVIGGTFKSKISTETKTQELSLLITESHYSKEVQKNLLINTANVLKYIHNDWRIKFKELEMFSPKQLNKGEGSEPVEYDLLDDEEIKKIFRSEKTIFWKCFFKIAEQTGARTIEVRTIQNNKINFEDDGTTSIEVYMTKTGKKKYVF